MLKGGKAVVKLKKKIIVYGLGKDYQSAKDYIKNKYDVIGYSDRNKRNFQEEGNYISPEELKEYEYDYICITSSKYFDEIRHEIAQIIGKEKESKIISIYDAFGDFRNYEVRDKWVIEQLEGLPEGNVLLDAGAGEQKYRDNCRHLKYIAQDFGQYTPDITVGGLLQERPWNYGKTDIICDIIDIPLADKTVDVILCTEVFEHLKNPILALKEFSRILKQGGKLILTAPFCCLTQMAPYFYYNGFSEYWYREHLKDYGFEIREFTNNGNYFKYLSQELFRVTSMAKKYCAVEMNSEDISAIIKSMDIMMRLSEMDKGSDETLCFGKMLVAEKIV